MWAMTASCVLSLLTGGRAAAAEAPQPAAAWNLYFQGKGLTARRNLEALLAAPEGQAPQTRFAALGALLEICLHGRAAGCLAPNATLFGAEAEKALTGEPEQRKAMARLAGYYIDAAFHAMGSPEADDKILSGWTWSTDNPDRGVDLYLRRQVLASNIQLSLGRTADATRTVDKILSLIASLRDPQESRFTVAWALSDVIGSLLATGDTDRALRVYRASGPFVSASLPPASVDAAVWRFTEAELLEEAGADGAARAALDRAIAAVDGMELDPEVRTWLLSRALTDKAVLCAARMDLDCARQALARHPLAELYAKPGRVPASFEETTYLAARAVAAGFGQTADPAAAAALRAPIAFSIDPATREKLEVYRAVGQAMASPPGPQRQANLREAGRRVAAIAFRKREVPFGAWYRSGAFDQLIFQLALTQSGAGKGAGQAEVDFTLHQLASRRGQSFDADALTLLGQTRTEMQRRSVHQALRLRARRDGLEQAAIRQMAERAFAARSGARATTYDPELRLRLRDFAVRIDAAAKTLAVVSDVNVATLKELQAVLAPDEAVLTLAPAMGDVAYMCVRRDSTYRRVVPVLLADYRVDFRLMQQALTAGHAPSAALDAQFPATSAVRLYDILIRPFEPCLKPGDRIIWLPALAFTQVPLAALLEQAPPKAAVGYDLSAAAWLVRGHAVSYAGAASTLVAARSARPPAAAFDFLGVGDPRLPAGGAPAFAGLAPLPETRDELERSARGFRDATVITGEAATEAGFRGQLTGAYRYLSFATHGLMRGDAEGVSEPALVLTPAAADNALDDGLLTASEIADLNLAARFVALSACNTANFDPGRVAEDLPALASAFAVAGVPATLGTLWPVNSQTGQQVTAATFEGLRAGRGASAALAEAQRAFLAAPPSPPYRHPRFWAPFVVLGDGGDAAPNWPSPSGLTVRSVERLTRGGGEVLHVEAHGGGVLASLQTERDAQGRLGAATRASGAAGEAWRRERRDQGAGAFVTRVGSRVLAGGYAPLADGRITPVLAALDPATGAMTGEWPAGPVPEPRAFVMAGAKLDATRAVFGVVTLGGPAATARPKLYGFEVDDALAPRKLFEVEAPAGRSIDEATFTPWGDALLVTYSARYAVRQPAAQAARASEDGFDERSCPAEAMTWIELRDGSTGALRAAKALRGHVVTSAIPRAGGGVLLGGAAHTDCAAEARGVVLAIDRNLRETAVYQDAALGASEVRSLSALRDGRVLVAANKDNVVDFRPLALAPGQRLDIHRLPLLYSGMLVTLGRDGAASPPLVLNAGASVLASTTAAGEGGDILVGGSVGDAAAIFHLAVEAPAR